MSSPEPQLGELLTEVSGIVSGVGGVVGYLLPGLPLVTPLPSLPPVTPLTPVTPLPTLPPVTPLTPVTSLPSLTVPSAELVPSAV